MLTAAQLADLRTFKLLLEHKNVDINFRDRGSCGYQVLHIAVAGKRADNIRHLLNDPRIDPLATSNNGDTAFDLAKRIGYRNIIDCFEDYNGSS
jgi:ankyrin repeat protein